jgi:Zn-dependent protease with chaperone function
MASARHLYRLQVGLGTLGVAATLTALVVAFTRVDFRLGSLDAVTAACRGMGLTDLSVASLAVLALSSLSLAVIGLAARSTVCQLRARRRFLATMRAVSSTWVAGHTAVVVDSRRPLAFCSGLLNPSIFISRGTVELLDDEELAAVVAHEAHHARRRDPLRVFVARALGEALFFLPAVRRLAERYVALAEVAADEAAVRHSGSRRPLAAALLAFDEAPSDSVVGIAPERVEHLLGEGPSWRLSGALLLGTALTLTGLFALALRTADATARASVDMPLLVAQTCMVAVTVAPVLAGAALVLASKRAVSRRRA